MLEIIGGTMRLNTKTILEKYDALNTIDEGESSVQAKRLGLAKTTVSNRKR